MRFHYIRIYGSLKRIDTELTRERFKRECPGFFSWNPRGDRSTVRRGFVISSHWFEPSVGPKERRVVVYAYLPKDQDTCVVCLNAGTMQKAGKLIQWLLKERDTAPGVAVCMEAGPV